MNYSLINVRVAFFFPAVFLDNFQLKVLPHKTRICTVGKLLHSVFSQR